MLAFKKTSKFVTLIFFMSGVMGAHGSFRQEAGNVVVIGQVEDRVIVNELAGFAETAQKINNQFFSHYLQQKIHVYLTSSEEEYHKFGMSEIPEWSSGIAYISQHIIVLKPGSYYDPALYRQTMIHEISHIYLGEITHSVHLPVWLNEGTVMYLSGRALSWEENIVVGNALAANKLLDLVDIERLLSFSNAKAKLAYLESLLAVRFLIERHGEKKLAEIIANLSTNKSLDQAFTESLGYDFFEFEVFWFQNLKNKFRWIAFLQFENLFFVALVGIIFLALIMRRYRNKKIYQRWEEEDLEY